MSRSRYGTVLLAWLLVGMGGAALAACLILPPWLEVRALRGEQQRAEAQIDALKRQVDELARQIEHLQSDPAYLERIGRTEFGFTPPGVELIPVEAVESAAQTQSVAQPPLTLAERVEAATRENPLVAVFVLDQSRPFVMGLGAAAGLVGLALLVPRPRGRA